jgi:hypothetical protein
LAGIKVEQPIARIHGIPSGCPGFQAVKGFFFQCPEDQQGKFWAEGEDKSLRSRRICDRCHQTGEIHKSDINLILVNAPTHDDD